MALRLSKFLGVRPSELTKLGVFNALIGIDSRLFVDPLLLKKLRIPEFRNSRKRFEKYFRDVLFLLAKSKKNGDAAWREAERRLVFRETKGISLGYGKSNSDGRGIGRVLGERLLESSAEIVSMGITDPEIFELLGLFEKDFGPDRLSDMTIRIILEDLFEYSARITKALGVKTLRTVRTLHNSYRLPVGPDPTKPIVFVPSKILRPLPVAQSWDEIGDVVWFNEALRHRINRIISKYWKKGIKVLKQNLRSTLFSNPDELKDLLKGYKRYQGKPYDVLSDPQGMLKWLELGQDYAQEYPVTLELRDTPSLDEIETLVRTIIEQYKKHIENNGLNLHLYDSAGKPLHERFAQRLFFSLADVYCKANRIDISPETNSGGGPVDFKFSRGYQYRVLAELKLSSNKQVVHGYRKQLPTYEQAEKTKRSAYIVIRVSNAQSPIKKVQRLYDAAVANGRKVPKLFIIDGRLKPSASKR
jgi:hypothetical protein